MSPVLPVCLPGWPQVYKVITYFLYASYISYFLLYPLCWVWGRVYYSTSWPQIHYVSQNDLDLWLSSLCLLSAGIINVCKQPWLVHMVLVIKCPRALLTYLKDSGNWAISQAVISSLIYYQVICSSISSMWCDVHKMYLYPLIHLPVFFQTLFLWNLH